MTTVRQALYGLALLAALGLYIWTQQLQLDAAKAGQALAEERQASAERGIAERDATLSVMGSLLFNDRTARHRLQTTQNRLTAALRQSELKREELTRELETYRLWAAQPLPGAAARLRERPTLTGAAAYLEWLSRRNALPVARDGAGAQRPPGQ